MQNWNNLYEKKGEFQKKPSQKIFAAIQFFQKNGAKKILDLGCGTGRHAQILAENFEIFGCDNSAAAIKIIQKKLGKKNFAICEMTNLIYENNFFDGIFCNQVLQHGKIAEIKSAVAEIFRVLKNGGNLFLTTISDRHPKFLTGVEIEPRTKIDTDGVDGHVPHHFFSAAEIREILAKFKILKLRHFFGKSEINPAKKMAAFEILAKKI